MIHTNDKQNIAKLRKMRSRIREGRKIKGSGRARWNKNMQENQVYLL